MSQTEVLELSTYSLTAIKKVCYKFSDTFSIKLEPVASNRLQLTFELLSGVDEQKLTGLVKEFYVELIDQDLRESIYKETESIRNLILAEAFSKTTLIEAE